MQKFKFQIGNELYKEKKKIYIDIYISDEGRKRKIYQSYFRENILINHHRQGTTYILYHCTHDWYLINSKTLGVCFSLKW